MSELTLFTYDWVPEPPRGCVRDLRVRWGVLKEREWLAGSFSIADILMADALRLVQRLDRLEKHTACRAYVERAVARPSFVKTHADQLAHFAAADGK